MIQKLTKNYFIGSRFRLVETIEHATGERWLDIESIVSREDAGKKFLASLWDGETGNWTKPRIDIWREILAEFEEVGVALLDKVGGDHNFIGVLTDAPIIAFNCNTNPNLYNSDQVDHTRKFVKYQYSWFFWYSYYETIDELERLYALDSVRFDYGVPKIEVEAK